MVGPGFRVKNDGDGSKTRELRNIYNATQLEIMNSPQVQRRALLHLESSNPELIAQNPVILNYGALYRADKSIYDLFVVSDSPEYAQLYLQACMEEVVLHNDTYQRPMGISHNATVAGKMEPLFIDETSKYNYIYGFILVAVIFTLLRSWKAVENNATTSPQN